MTMMGKFRFLNFLPGFQDAPLVVFVEISSNSCIDKRNIIIQNSRMCTRSTDYNKREKNYTFLTRMK